SIPQPRTDHLAQTEVFLQLLRIVFLGIPAAVPILDNTQPEADRMYLLTHALSLFSLFHDHADIARPVPNRVGTTVRHRAPAPAVLGRWAVIAGDLGDHQIVWHHLEVVLSVRRRRGDDFGDLPRCRRGQEAQDGQRFVHPLAADRV